MCEQKMIDHTYIFYNVMFYNQNEGDSCCSQLCAWEKCICIDNEQVGLLRKLLSPNDLIEVWSLGEHFVFKNSQNPLKKNDFCEDSSEEIANNYSLFPNRFFPHYVEIMEKMIQARNCPVLGVKNVVKAIPILYTTNSKHGFKERDSLIYLCKYAPCAETYLMILFRALICKAIGCCQSANPEEKEKYLTDLINFLNRLKEILEQDDKDMIEQCDRNVQRYLQKWCELINRADMPCMPITDELQDYLKELEGLKGETSSVNSAGTLYNLYLLLKKILETADLSVSKLPKLPFENFSNSVGTDYDQVINDRIFLFNMVCWEKSEYLSVYFDDVFW